VTDLDEVVYLCAGPDSGLADGGAVDAGIGLDFNRVLKDGRAGLEDLVPASVGLLCEAEAVGADDGSVLEDDVVAELAVLANDRVGMREEVVAGADVRIDDDVGEDDGVVPEGDVVADDGVCADVCVGADLRSGGDNGCGVDAGCIGGRLIEEFDSPGEGEVGVVDTKGGSGDLGE
jgi:hypothetical protein